MLRIGMLTSGGDCQALNAAMRGVVKGICSKRDDVEIYGFKDGYKGLIYADFSMLTPKDFSGILTRGGTILGTSRQPFKLMRVPDKDGLDKVEAMKHTYHKLNLNCLIILGGNGTHKTANLLREEGLNVITLPKTIDNDLYGTDHCPGFASAAKYVATSCMELYHDSRVYDKNMICVVEIMGRHAGWLAGSASVATYMGQGPDLIYLPEVDFDMEQFIADVRRIYEATGECFVAVSEGIHDKNGTLIAEYGVENAPVDAFGHKQLGGLASTLVNILRGHLGNVKMRGIELSLLQRCAAHCASETDVQEAFLAGKSAVEYAVNGVTDKMVGFERKYVNGVYVCETKLFDLTVVANAEKKVPREWINEEGDGVNEKFIEYALPLIQGQTQLAFENGLPRFVNLKKIKA